MTTEATIQVRIATARDVPAIRAVADRTWRATYGGLLAEADITSFLDWNYSEENVGRSIGRLGSGYLVALAGGEIVGYAMAGMNRADEAELFAIYVVPEYQGRGAGYRLWHQAAEHLRANGADRVVL
jgi:ribosomal protein S18 acetylase RimI-like enzyme